MEQTPFENCKTQPAADLRETCDYANLEDRLMGTRMEIPRVGDAKADEALLVKILKYSHEGILAGRSYSQEAVERHLDQHLYELKDKMVGTSTVESY